MLEPITAAPVIRVINIATDIATAILQSQLPALSWTVRVSESTLATRLGCTVHVSPLRMKLCRLFRAGHGNAHVLEDWLVDVANARGARIVTRSSDSILLPGESVLSNEELVVGILLPQNLDRPQMLRLAAQLISREAVQFRELRLLAMQERIERILAELARQALRVAPDHVLWRKLDAAFGNQKPLRSPLLHYTRMAEPVPMDGRVNAKRWSLVA